MRLRSASRCSRPGMCLVSTLCSPRFLVHCSILQSLVLGNPPLLCSALALWKFRFCFPPSLAFPLPPPRSARPSPCGALYADALSVRGSHDDLDSPLVYQRRQPSTNYIRVSSCAKGRECGLSGGLKRCPARPMFRVEDGEGSFQLGLSAAPHSRRCRCGVTPQALPCNIESFAAPSPVCCCSCICDLSPSLFEYLLALIIPLEEPTPPAAHLQMSLFTFHLRLFIFLCSFQAPMPLLARVSSLGSASPRLPVVPASLAQVM